MQVNEHGADVAPQVVVVLDVLDVEVDVVLLVVVDVETHGVKAVSHRSTPANPGGSHGQDGAHRFRTLTQLPVALDHLHGVPHGPAVVVVVEELVDV